jgi:hypothetical protein
MKKLNTTYLDNLVSKILTETLEEKADSLVSKIKGDMCECGGKMYEGECNECGSNQRDMYEGSEFTDNRKKIDVAEPKGKITSADFKKLRKSKMGEISKKYGGKHGMEEGIYDVDDLDSENSFDYVEESQDINVDDRWEDEDKEKTCKSHIQLFGEDDPVTQEMCVGVKIDESFKGRQRRLNKDNKVETKESGKKFPDLTGDGKVTRKDVLVGRGVKLGKSDSKKKIKESYSLTENEMIDLIEKIIKEEKEKSNIKLVGGSPRGLEKHKQIQLKNGKENDNYLKLVTAKMKDYLKDGSKGEYSMNPKTFPVGNGELEEMDKMAFETTDDLEDFNYEIAGLNLPTPDAVEFNEDFMNNLYTGNSKTGNAPGGNALESKANERFNKLRKKNTLKKLKDQSYNRVSQPVFNEKPGTEKGKGMNIKLESTEDKKVKLINEEFDRMKSLIGYSRKTQ